VRQCVDIDDLGPADWPVGLPPLAHTAPLSGGLVCRVRAGTLTDGRPVVVKRCPYPAGVEADGLMALATAGAPVPAVLGAQGDVLVLERVGGDETPPDWAGLGSAVARLHRTTGPRYGWHCDNASGRIVQHNGWCDDWPTFFVERRVRVHLPDPAVPEPLRLRLERACAGPLPALLPARPAASLTHGDLWAGNVVDGRWLLDPAVAYADRELDLAYMDGSAGLPAEFHAAYRAELPPDPGYARRRPALQLHTLLVHLRHFGERYVPRIEAVLDGYGW
jgi:fructosamine-3-kinase